MTFVAFPLILLSLRMATDRCLIPVGLWIVSPSGPWDQYKAGVNQLLEDRAYRLLESESRLGSSIADMRFAWDLANHSMDFLLQPVGRFLRSLFDRHDE